MFTLIRRPVSPSRRISDDAVPQQPAVAEDGVDHAIIEEDEPITPDTRSELPFVDKRETLYLTAPALEAEPYVWPYVRIAEAIRRLPPDLTLRCFKSATLIAKVRFVYCNGNVVSCICPGLFLVRSMLAGRTSTLCGCLCFDGTCPC